VLTSDQSPPEGAEFLRKLAEAYGKLSPEEQRHLLAHVDTFLNLLSTSSLGDIQQATESLSQPSSRLVVLTQSLERSTSQMIWLTTALVIESLAIAGLTVALLLHA
jgi:hypothetical protein